MLVTSPGDIFKRVPSLRAMESIFTQGFVSWWSLSDTDSEAESASESGVSSRLFCSRFDVKEYVCLVFLFFIFLGVRSTLFCAVSVLSASVLEAESMKSIFRSRSMTFFFNQQKVKEAYTDKIDILQHRRLVLAIADE